MNIVSYSIACGFGALLCVVFTCIVLWLLACSVLCLTERLDWRNINHIVVDVMFWIETVLEVCVLLAAAFVAVLVGIMVMQIVLVNIIFQNLNNTIM